MPDADATPTRLRASAAAPAREPVTNPITDTVSSSRPAPATRRRCRPLRSTFTSAPSYRHDGRRTMTDASFNRRPDEAVKVRRPRGLLRLGLVGPVHAHCRQQVLVQLHPDGVGRGAAGRGPAGPGRAGP